MKKIALWLSFIGLFGWAGILAAGEGDLVVADFDQGEAISNLDQPVEIWLREDGSDKTQNCAMSFVEGDALGKQGGHAVRLDYDVESENPAYNGIRTALPLIKSSDYKTLNLYLKGDPAKGFTKRLKIELIGEGKPPSPYMIEGITDEWQKFSIPLGEFWIAQSDTPLEKFVVVFADINSDPKVGAIYLDEVSFSKE